MKRLVGIVAAALASSICVATPATATEPCKTVQSCVELLTQQTHSVSISASEAEARFERRKAARVALTSMESDAVARALADVLADKSKGLRRAGQWSLETLPEKTRQALVLDLLGRGTDTATLIAGEVMRWPDGVSVRARIDTLPDTESDAIRERVSRLARVRNKMGPASLALLLDEPERTEALAHQLSRAYSFDAPRTLRYLNRIDPNRARDLVLPKLRSSKKPTDLLIHLSDARWGRDANYAWLRTIWTERSLPDAVRVAALHLTLDADNTAPIPWSTELEQALVDPGIAARYWSAILSLYGDDALGTFEREFEAEPDARDTLLHAAARSEGLDPQRLVPLVREALEERGDYEVTAAALSVWRAHDLPGLDADVRKAAAAHPFDFVQRLADETIPFDPKSQRPLSYGTSGSRTALDYCSIGTPLGNRQRARDMASAAGVPKRPEVVYGIDLAAVTAAANYDGAVYIGYNRGEFGGGLVRYAADGTSEQVLDLNVQFIAAIDPTKKDGGMWVMAGLNHLVARGGLYRLDDAGLHRVMRLPSEVTGLSVDGESYVLAFHRADMEPERWKSYHPPLRLAPDGTLSPPCGTP